MEDQNVMDPISFDGITTLEDWITGKDVSLEDYGTSEWKALDPVSLNKMLLGPPVDEVEELGAGNYTSSDP